MRSNTNRPRLEWANSDLNREPQSLYRPKTGESALSQGYPKWLNLRELSARERRSVYPTLVMQKQTHDRTRTLRHRTVNGTRTLPVRPRERSPRCHPPSTPIPTPTLRPMGGARRNRRPQQPQRSQPTGLPLLAKRRRWPQQRDSPHPNDHLPSVHQMV